MEIIIVIITLILAALGVAKLAIKMHEIEHREKPKEDRLGLEPLNKLIEEIIKNLDETQPKKEKPKEKKELPRCRTF